jgi:hypothetical protein
VPTPAPFAGTTTDSVAVVELAFTVAVEPQVTKRYPGGVPEVTS